MGTSIMDQKISRLFDFPIFRQFRRNCNTAQTALSPSFVGNLPEEDLKDIFIHCDVPTRCRLRRVCRYWKQLVCRPEISQVVIVQEICLMIVTHHPRRKTLSRKLCGIFRSSHSFSRLERGYYYHDTNWGGQDSNVSLVDHKRHGILGDHVRVLIYDNEWDYRHYGRHLLEIIRSIAFYCSNLQQVVLWHITFGMPDYFDFSMWTPRSGLQHTVAVTRVDSYRFIGSVNRSIEDLAKVLFRTQLQYAPRYSRLERKISCQQVAGELRKGMIVDPELLSWVAKFAPDLPDGFHSWAKRGISLYSNIDPIRANGCRYFPSIDLRQIASYTGMDYDLAQILGSCILFCNMPNVTHPPASLITRLCS